MTKDALQNINKIHEICWPISIIIT